MIPIIYDTDFNALAELSDYISFIWTTRYYQAGDFELVLPINTKNISLCRKGYYIHRLDCPDWGIIEKINLTTNTDGVEQLIVSGRFLPAILGRRVIAEQTEFNNKTVGAIIEKLVNDAIISPTDEARKIDNFNFTDNGGLTDTLSVQYTGKNLLEAIQDLALSNYIGFNVIRNTNGFYMYTYAGVNRSYSQTANPYIVFSDDFDNLLSSDYTEDYSTLITNVLTAGEGEGTARKTAWATIDNPTGINRYEAFVDARNISSNDGAISTSDYLAQLKAKGLENITTMSKAFTGEVSLNNYIYGTDFNIGDIVTIKNDRWGIAINTRLIEMIESTAENGEHTFLPTFGN